MSKRDHSLLIEDIIDSANKILEYTSDLSRWSGFAISSVRNPNESFPGNLSGSILNIAFSQLSQSNERVQRRKDYPKNSLTIVLANFESGINLIEPNSAKRFKTFRTLMIINPD
jgi:hypothetical protein